MSEIHREVRLNLQSNIGFAIGNGLSRSDFDLNTLAEKGITVGCNSIHKDFCPDIIVALDKDPIADINAMQDRKFKFLTTNEKRTGIVLDGKEVMGILEVNGGFGRNSGIVAVSYMSKILRLEKVYMLGFDFFRFRPGIDKTNDIYNNHICLYRGFDKAWNMLWDSCPHTEFVRVGSVPDWDKDYFAGLHCRLIDYKEFASETNRL